MTDNLWKSVERQGDKGRWTAGLELLLGQRQNRYASALD